MKITKRVRSFSYRRNRKDLVSSLRTTLLLCRLMRDLVLLINLVEGSISLRSVGMAQARGLCGRQLRPRMKAIRLS